jgi:hypothetical protein
MFIRQKHLCRYPAGVVGASGDLWMCEDCGAIWRYSAFWQAWSKLRNRRRINRIRLKYVDTRNLFERA